MATKIEKTIIDYQVVGKEKPSETSQVEDLVSKNDSPVDNIIQMHERLERPQRLVGSTYKFKPGGENKHAFYVTINDIILNEDTPYERRRPFEIFVNSKNMEHFQWMVALTRLISAVFRKGGDITFLVEELQAVFDPNGGYWKPGGGGFMPSIVAEIGTIIETHMKTIGMIKDDEMSESRREHLAQKRREYEQQNLIEKDDENYGGFPAGSKMCRACHTKAVVFLDGCLTCLNCGDSKCS